MDYSSGRQVALPIRGRYSSRDRSKSYPGGVRHKQERDKGEVPHASLDTQAHGMQSSWHGRVDGWKLHLASLVAGIWIPLAAFLTPANEADHEVAPARLDEGIV